MKQFSWHEMTGSERKLGIGWLRNAVVQANGHGDNLPDDFFPLTGVTVTYNDTPVAVMTVYFELTAQAAIAGFCMVKNDLPANIKHHAAETALAAAEEYVRLFGKKYLLTFFGSRAVNRMADRMGFITGDRNAEGKLKLVK